MSHTIHMPLPEIDVILVFWKTRLVELTAELVPLLQVGNEKSITQFHRLRLLNGLKKTLRDYRFQSIYLTKAEMEKCIKMGNEIASIY